MRTIVLLAAAASLLLDVAMLAPSLYTLQVFDRVFASRSVETPAMLSVLVLLALGFGYCMDQLRCHAIAARAGQRRHPRPVRCAVVADLSGGTGDNILLQ